MTDHAALAEEYGTPLFVYEADTIAAQYTGLRQRLHPAMDVFYSLKANPNLALCGQLRALGAGAEVSSLLELTTAREAGVPPGDIVFPGPGKSREEIAACLDAGIYAIICESFEELELVDELARERGVRARVALRVNPAFAVKGSGLTMGGKPRQFGIDESQLFALPGLRLAHLRVVGVHVYLGTRILDEAVIAENTRRILTLAERLAAHLDFPLEFVDVGGGLGVAYFDGERDLSVARLTDLVNPVVADFHDRHRSTRLIMELGRYLVAPAGTYLVRVRYVKTSMGERFAVTDGGTHQHMAAVGIGSFVKRDFPLRLLGRPADGPLARWTVTGPLCTPNDTLARAAELPDLRRGDLLGVLRSGAYGPSASPTLFLGHGHPAEVLVRDGVGHLIRHRDQVADLLRQQRSLVTTGGDPR
ncbi:type III PLP-dependent enzyme [Micromonospora coxensis]|uniref:Diaminopimelate decarboxylase n=1 Tax=Micromonospora coxensis TaxID=356852 RepID=A0A1C5K0G5_9ACTN|nr:type III PLP-dependent enzyme [Micromonospora coxensis]SCG76310.1 diaminopimelate decarboxylase [Micromonospora coxensis]